MYIQRNIDVELEKWRLLSSRKPLMLRGARQVGKSSSVRNLGKKFNYFIEVNFDENPTYKTVFEQGRTSPLYLQGEMIAHDVERDLALIRIDTTEELGKIATLAPRSRSKVIDTFSEIYTVGCPLGTPVQATSGEISREDWKMEVEDYWMISTPAYFGNSGGGVFLAETCELIGIFSKIYTTKQSHC